MFCMLLTFFRLKKKKKTNSWKGSPELSYSLTLMPLRRVVLQNVLFSWCLCSLTTLRFLALSWKAAARNQISSAHSSQYVRHQTVRMFVPSQTNIPRKQTGGLVVAMIWSGSKQNNQLDCVQKLNIQVCDVHRHCWKPTSNHSWTEHPDLQSSELWGCAQDRWALSPRVGCMYTYQLRRPLAWLHDGRRVQSDPCFSVSEVKCAFTSRLFPFASIRIKPPFCTSRFSGRGHAFGSLSSLNKSIGILLIVACRKLGTMQSWLANEA